MSFIPVHMNTTMKSFKIYDTFGTIPLVRLPLFLYMKYFVISDKDIVQHILPIHIPYIYI